MIGGSSAVQKNLSPKFKKHVVLHFGSKFGSKGLDKKSIFTSILKVSDKFVKKFRRSRYFCIYAIFMVF